MRDSQPSRRQRAAARQPRWPAGRPATRLACQRWPAASERHSGRANADHCWRASRAGRWQLALGSPAQRQEPGQLPQGPTGGARGREIRAARPAARPGGSGSRTRRHATGCMRELMSRVRAHAPEGRHKPTTGDQPDTPVILAAPRPGRRGDARRPTGLPTGRPSWRARAAPQRA